MAGIYGSTDSRRSLGQSAEQGDFLSCHSGLGLVPCDCHPALTFSPTHQWAVRSRAWPAPPLWGWGWGPVQHTGGPPGDTVGRQTPPHHCSEPLIHSFSGRTWVWMRAQLLTSALLVQPGAHHMLSPQAGGSASWDLSIHLCRAKMGLNVPRGCQGMKQAPWPRAGARNVAAVNFLRG